MNVAVSNVHNDYAQQLNSASVLHISPESFLFYRLTMTHNATMETVFFIEKHERTYNFLVVFCAGQHKRFLLKSFLFNDAVIIFISLIVSYFIYMSLAARFSAFSTKQKKRLHSIKSL